MQIKSRNHRSRIDMQNPKFRTAIKWPLKRKHDVQGRYCRVEFIGKL